MASLLTPTRKRGHEILDDPDIDDALRARSLADVARSNAMFGGWQAVRAELALVLNGSMARNVSLLDVGTGIGDIPSLAAETWRARGVRITTFGIDKKRLTSKGWGLEKPIDTNETDEGRQNNRRVEFHIEATGDPTAKPAEPAKPAPKPAPAPKK